MRGRYFLFMIFFIVVGGALYVVNQRIQDQVAGMIKTGDPVVPVKRFSPAAPSTGRTSRKQIPIRKSQLSPGRDYMEHVFYVGHEEVARQRVSRDGEVLRQSGKIPNGRVKFIDEFKKIKGEEFYINEKREGMSRSKYENGQLYQEITFRGGKIMSKREYYPDGSLHLEVDYSDAKGDYLNDPEVGKGKLYDREGALKYEWDLTYSAERGFKKAYNRNGELMAEMYYVQ